MKKKGIVIIAIVLSLVIITAGCWCYNWLFVRNGVYVGMPVSKFNDAIPPDQRIDYLHYSFYNSISGHAVVTEWTYPYNEITDIHVYSKQGARPTLSAASEITAGMSVYDVVSRLGIPMGTATSGMITLCFQLENGSRAVVYFDNQDSMKVTSTIIES